MANDPNNALTLHSTLSDASQRQIVEKMLAELLITVSDQLFENRTVVLDGYRFINCSFENCRLKVYRGTFELHHCSLKNVKREISEGAQKAVQFYTFTNIALQVIPAFGPKIYPDGSISIAKGISQDV